MKKEEQLNRYFDGELSLEEKSILEDALASDSELASRLAELESYAEIHKNLAPEPKDDLFIERECSAIFEKLTEEDSKKVVSFPAKWLVRSMATAAALLLAVTGIWGWNNYRGLNNGSAYPSPQMAMVETDIVGASSMIYTDEQSGWTFVWIDEPEVGSVEEIAG